MIAKKIANVIGIKYDALLEACKEAWQITIAIIILTIFFRMQIWQAWRTICRC